MTPRRAVLFLVLCALLLSSHAAAAAKGKRGGKGGKKKRAVDEEEELDPYVGMPAEVRAAILPRGCRVSSRGTLRVDSRAVEGWYAENGRRRRRVWWTWRLRERLRR